MSERRDPLREQITHALFAVEAWTEGYAAGAAAERLRLHTQLRDPALALAVGRQFEFGDEPYCDAYQAAHPDTWGNAEGYLTACGRDLLQPVWALLGVAATPQPGEQA